MCCLRLRRHTHSSRHSLPPRKSIQRFSTVVAKSVLAADPGSPGPLASPEHLKHLAHKGIHYVSVSVLVVSKLYGTAVALIQNRSLRRTENLRWPAGSLTGFVRWL